MHKLLKLPAHQGIRLGKWMGFDHSYAHCKANYFQVGEESGVQVTGC